MDRVVHTFRMISNEEEEFQRDFEIFADQTFFDLHLAIQNNLGYDKSQMASFILTSDKWEREAEITLFDMSDEPSENALIMDKVSIDEICTNLRQKLLYTYDFFSDRSFFIELVKIADADPHVEYPRCILAKGKIPVQIIMEDNNIDTLPVEQFDDLDSFEEDLSCENLDDFEDF